MKIANFVLFLALFIGIYGGFHVYVYFKVRPFFVLHPWLVIAILTLLGSSIFLAIALIRNSVASPTATTLVTTLATPVAYIAFIWMGILFLFFAISVPFDLVSWITGKANAQSIHSYLVSPNRTTVIAIAVLLISVYGYWASLRIHIERLVFHSANIAKPIKIVQISDLHLGILSDRDYCQKVVDEINALEADIVVSTGDLVDMQLDHLDELANLMSRIRARYGKYAILGNHEALAGVKASREFIEKIGFKLLSNRGVTIDNAVNLIGVDDPAVAGRVRQSNVEEPALLRQFDNGLYTILLKHQPVVGQHSIGLFNLQLSGHTHGGQIFPFGMLIHLFYQAPFGLSKQGDNGWLYVSRGTGTWGPPMRVLAKPEITLIELHHGKPQ